MLCCRVHHGLMEMSTDRMAQQPLGDSVNMRAKFRALRPAAREEGSGCSHGVSTHVQCTVRLHSPCSTAQDGFSWGRRAPAPSVLLQDHGRVPL